MESTDLRVELVDPKELTLEDRELLEKSVSQDPYGVKLDKILDLADQQLVRIFKINEPFHAIVVVESVHMLHGKTLFIMHLAGSGVIKHKELLIEFLKEVAKVNQCVALACATARIGAVRVYESMGFQPLMYVYGRRL